MNLVAMSKQQRRLGIDIVQAVDVNLPCEDVLMVHWSLYAWIVGVVIALYGFFMTGDASTIFFGIAIAVVGFTQMRRLSTAKLNTLSRGMTFSQLQAVLGSPNQKELKGNSTIYRYLVFSFGSGWKPAYVVFGPDDRLAESYIDQAEYEREVDRLLKAFKEQRKREEMAQRER